MSCDLCLYLYAEAVSALGTVVENLDSVDAVLLVLGDDEAEL